MEINFDAGDQHAVLTLSSSAPINRALLCASLEWDQPMPVWRSMHERDAIAIALADIARQVGAMPLVLDCAVPLPTHVGYERTGKATRRSRVENAAAAVSVAARSTS